jgi:DNA repair protein RadA/Sms
MAVASSYTDRPVPGDWAVMGEVGLAGEVRAIPLCDRRITECARLGFSTVILPKENLKRLTPPEGIRCVGVDTVMQAVAVAF